MAKANEKECCKHGGKKVLLGCLVFLLGMFWYLRRAGYITYPYFWPVVVMVLGVLVVIKGIIRAAKK